MVLGVAVCRVIVSLLFLKARQDRWFRANSWKVWEHHPLLSLVQIKMFLLLLLAELALHRLGSGN